MRKVNVFKIGVEVVDGKTTFPRLFVGVGVFHQFGVDYEEFESGAGNFSTAIVEMPDGKILNYAVHLVEFIEPLESGK